MLKVAVVGCGWLGYPLALSFIEKGYSVLGTTTTKEKVTDLQGKGVIARFWKISDCIIKEDVSFLEKMDVLIVNIPPSKVDTAFEYSTVLENLVQHLSKTIKIIFISTTSVYPDDLKIADEKYTWTKQDTRKQTVLAEIKLSNYLKNRLTILRFSGLVGPNRHPVKFLAGKIDVPNGNASVNLIHLNDAVGLINTIIETNYWGEIINGCFPIHPKRNEYYTKAADFYKLSRPIFSPDVVCSKIVSSSKSELELNYIYKFPITNFDE